MGVIRSHEKTFCLGTHLTKSKGVFRKGPVVSNSTGLSMPESILVIDSGVGGLSICQSILAQQPTLQIIYFADSAYFPYGLMPEKELRARLIFIVGKMLALHRPKLVVLACNTVSTLVLPELRSMFDIPFVGVVPAIKPAAILSKNKRIGLLATPATVSRPYTDQLIDDYAQGCEVIKVGSSELVDEAESLLNNHSVNQKVIDHILNPFRVTEDQLGVDTVVLGCTHFPLLKNYLSDSLPAIHWVDSGEAVANRVTHLLAAFSKPGLDKLQFESEPHQLYFSKPVIHKDEFSNGLQNLGFKSFQLQAL